MSDDEILIFETKWNELYSEGIEKIFRIAEQKNKETINLQQYTQLYTIVYDICSSKSSLIAMKLYERILETIKKYCIKLQDKNQTSRYDLEEFVKFWRTFEDVILKWFIKLFSYFTRQTIKVKRNINLIMDLKMIFKENLYDKASKELNLSFFNLINIERKNEANEPNSTIKGYIEFLTSIEINYMENLYNNIFENEIWENTLNYYQPEISKKLSLPFIDYLKWGMNIIGKEFERFANCLPQKSVVFIINNLREKMFFIHGKHLIESQEGLKYLLAKQDWDSLKKAYNVFGSDNKISAPIFHTNFKNFIKEEFLKLILKNESLCQETDGPQEIVLKTKYIEEFIQFYLTYQKIITLCFEGCNIINVVYKEVIENIQSSSSKFNISYILPFFIDNKLKLQNISKEDLEAFVELIISIFPSLPDKDVFIDIHKNLVLLFYF